MQRPNEALTLASHRLGGQRPAPKPAGETPQGE
jgi:hypothetical protein